MKSKQLTENLRESGLNPLITKLDHIAYRVKMGEREKVLLEFANLVPYREFKTFSVASMKAITSCIKLHETSPVIVVSEGLSEDSIVEKYVKKYGSRIHHLAYSVTDIEKVVIIQRKRGVQFTTDSIIGSQEEGIKQIFTKPTKSVNHIIEYIQRFGDFDGFFTPSNIGLLMKSTEKLGES
ncbi:MAG: VOC family protein [Candidatus Heimdallarchaeaceae archaeon]